MSHPSHRLYNALLRLSTAFSSVALISENTNTEGHALKLLLNDEICYIKPLSFNFLHYNSMVIASELNPEELPISLKLSLFELCINELKEVCTKANISFVIDSYVNLQDEALEYLNKLSTLTFHFNHKADVRLSHHNTLSFIDDDVVCFLSESLMKKLSDLIMEHIARSERLLSENYEQALISTYSEADPYSNVASSAASAVSNDVSAMSGAPSAMSDASSATNSTAIASSALSSAAMSSAAPDISPLPHASTIDLTVDAMVLIDELVLSVKELSSLRPDDALVLPHFCNNDSFKVRVGNFCALGDYLEKYEVSPSHELYHVIRLNSALKTEANLWDELMPEPTLKKFLSYLNAHHLSKTAPNELSSSSHDTGHLDSELLDYEDVIASYDETDERQNTTVSAQQRDHQEHKGPRNQGDPVDNQNHSDHLDLNDFSDLKQDLLEGGFNLDDTMYEKAALENEVKLSLDSIEKLPIKVDLVLDRLELNLGEVKNLKEGSALSLKENSLSHIKIYAQGRLIGYGKVIELDGAYALQVKELFLKE